MKTDPASTTSRIPRPGLVICLGVAMALLLLSALAYPHMAPELVTRPAGNGHGQSSPSREFTAVALPLALAIVGGLVALAPKFTPRFLERFPAGAVVNTENSVRVLNGVLILIACIFATLHIGLLAMYAGMNFPLEAAMGTVVGATLVGLGVLLPWTRPEGHFRNKIVERYRAVSARAYRPAGYLLVTAGIATMILAWLSSRAAMVVGVGALVIAFGFIVIRGVKAAGAKT